MQTDLFDTPIARASDPDSSKRAAAEYTRTRRAGDCAVMRELIAELPGRTAGEYGQALLDRGYAPMKAIRMPTKRISDLKAAGELIIGEHRVCSISGRSARTYYLKRSAVNGGRS